MSAEPAKREDHRFCANAMATKWDIFVDAAIPERDARGAADAAFAELQHLEDLLSRFEEGSEVSMLNAAAGRPVRVGPETMEVLRTACGMCRATGGAFDICYASPRGSPIGPDAIEFDAAAHTARLRDPRLKVDLGGIGKGYALDRMAARMEHDWEVSRLMMNGGGSSVLALDAPGGRRGWPVTLETADGRELRTLVRVALGASGFSVKGDHIVDPHTGHPVHRRVRTWARAPSAAVADALSTAFTVMDLAAVEKWVAAHPGTGARVLLEEQGKRRVVAFGDWGPAEAAGGTPNIEHRTSNTEHRTSNVERRASTSNAQR